MRSGLPALPLPLPLLAVALAVSAAVSARAAILQYRIGIIGDYGVNNTDEGAVAQLLAGLQVSDIITAGDNNYVAGGPDTIDANIGQFYHQWVYPYTGAYGSGAADGANHFWPSIGNHDWYWIGGNPNNGTTRYYEAYFPSLPAVMPQGNRRYYKWSLGPNAGGTGVPAADFFAISSDQLEPDGRTADSTQAQWLRAQLAASCAVFRFVYFHHPPYSSGTNPVAALRWPFAEWGADAVLTGHDHIFDRILAPTAVTGGPRVIPYFVNGVGGASLGSWGPVADGSQFRYRGFGAQVLALSVDADAPFGANTHARFDFFASNTTTAPGVALDSYTIAVSPTALPRPDSCPAPNTGGGGGGGKGLRPGVVAVIVLAVLFVVGVAGGLFWYRRKRQQRFTTHHELHDRDAINTL